MGDYSLGFDEDVSIGRIQHCITDELLSDGDGLIHRHTQVRQVVQKPERSDGEQDSRINSNIRETTNHD